MMHEIPGNLLDPDYQRWAEPMNSMLKSLIVLGGTAIESHDRRLTHGVLLPSGDKVFVIPMNESPEPFGLVNAVITVRDDGHEDLREESIAFELDGMDERYMTARKLTITADQALTVTVDVNTGNGYAYSMKSRQPLPMDIIFPPVRSQQKMHGPR